MKKFVLIFVGILATWFSASAQNDALYETVLDQTVALSCNKSLLVDVFENSFKSSLPEGMLSDEKCHALSEEVVELMYPQVVDMTKEMWRREFSFNELKQLRVWLSSSTGQKLLGLTTKTAELQQQLLKDPEFLQQMTAIITKYVQ